MKWSWRIATVAGIGIYLHVTFAILIVWFGLFYYKQQGAEAAIKMVGLLLAGFTCVVLHELGHALAARRFGIRTRDITLLPIGGVARLERMPEKPWQELIVALAGPAVNVVIAIVLLPLALPWIKPQGMATNWPGQGLAANLLAWNVIMVVFNLIPAFPMDGGRVLRALLAMQLDYVQATRVAASIGQGIAFLFGAFGVFTGHIMLMLIAVFVFMSAGAEAAGAATHATMQGIPVRHAMITEFHSLAIDAQFQDAVAALLDSNQQDFPVTEDGHVVGVLLRRDLLEGLAREGPTGKVRDAMTCEFTAVDDRETLDAVFMRMESSGCPVLPVVHNGELVGMVTADNIGEFLMVKAALGQRRNGRTRA